MIEEVVKLWFFVVYVRCEVLYHSAVLDNAFLLILIVVIFMFANLSVPFCVVICFRVVD